jgi:Response regulator containing CheY-like receiver domain and AraC-type DNA-binding domain
MKEFDVIRLLFIAIPTGMFTTYGIFWAIILMLKVKKTEEAFRKIMSFYSLFAGITGFLLVVFYFFPDVFACLNILYCVFAAYTMILFYHFLFHAAGLNKRFSMLHYIPPALAGVILFIFSILFPEKWTRYGNDISLFISLIFGIIYSVLPLYEMYKFQLAISIKLGTPAAVDKGKAIPFVCEILLYPTASILLPLVGGTHPSIIISILLMLCCLTALVMNIPLTYALIRHYIGISFSNTSLFESAMLPVIQPVSTVEKQTEEQDDATAKPAYPGYSDSKRRKGQPVELNKKVFEVYFRTHKPYLNPKLTIIDLVEPLSSNRTYISKFVNQVYGISFSSYVNLCRLREMKRLLALPSNKGKSEAVLCLKAGFGKYRNYLYVKKQFSALIPLKKEKTNG